MWTIFDIIVFAAGFAACWFSKDWIKAQVLSAESFAASLEAKARKIREML